MSVDDKNVCAREVPEGNMLLVKRFYRDSQCAKTLAYEVLKTLPEVFEQTPNAPPCALQGSLLRLQCASSGS